MYKMTMGSLTDSPTHGQCDMLQGCRDEQTNKQTNRCREAGKSLVHMPRLARASDGRAQHSLPRGHAIHSLSPDAHLGVQLGLDLVC